MKIERLKEQNNKAYERAGEDKEKKVYWDTKEKKIGVGERYAAMCTAGET